MIIKGKEYRSVWREKNIVYLIDQTKLPFEFSIVETSSYADTVDCIKRMAVRGAPAIGVAGAYAYVQAAYEFGKDSESLAKASMEIRAARPTAVDLMNVIDEMKQIDQTLSSLEEASEKIADRIVESCKKISEFGSSLIKQNAIILTHCHTGAPAAVDHGTALGAIKQAYNDKKNIFVYVDETRPRIQGALTSWELLEHGVPSKVLVDGAAGSLLKSGKVDMVIVGADRICANGDFANKIGTYSLAVLAKENGVPFYVAAPLTTFDFNLKDGSMITIEERKEEEVLMIQGKRIYVEGVHAFNPAFDVTPAQYVSGYITELGVFESIDELKNKIK